MPKPYAREFREEVVRVARKREPGVRVKDVAHDFGITESCLTNRMSRADRDDGVRLGPTTSELVDLRDAKRRIPTHRAHVRPSPIHMIHGFGFEQANWFWRRVFAPACRLMRTLKALGYDGMRTGQTGC